MPRSNIKHASSYVESEIQSNFSVWHNESVHSSTSLPKRTVKGEVSCKNYMGYSGATAALSLES